MYYSSSHLDGDSLDNGITVTPGLHLISNAMTIEPGMNTVTVTGKVSTTIPTEFKLDIRSSFS